MSWDREMQKALELDGEKLRQLTGEDHGPQFFTDCHNCSGGIIAKRVTIYEGGGWYYDTDEQSCPECGGTGLVETGWEPSYRHCDMGVGCDEVGVCYAEAHGQPERCPSFPSKGKPSP